MTNLAEQDELEGEGEESPAIDPREIALFVLSCARRHIGASVLVAVAIAALGFAAAVLLPKKYGTETRILIGEEGFMSQLFPNRRERREDEFRGVTERVFLHDNLRKIIEEAELARRWTEFRPPILRFKDQVLGRGLNDMDEKTRTRVLMGTLANRLYVQTDPPTTIIIGATWSDPETATRIVEVARKRFFEDRLQRELDVFQEVLAIQEEQGKAAAAKVDELLKRVEEAHWPQGKPSSAPAATKTETKVVRVKAAQAKEHEPDPLVVAKLEKVRQKIREAQQPWQRRVTELKLQLTDLRATYGEKHPLIIHQKARLEKAEVPPPELAELKAEEADLLAQIESYSKPSDGEAKHRTVVVRTGGEAPTSDQPMRIEQSATISTEQAKLIKAIGSYNELSEQIANTRLEITSAEAAFKHRYLIAADAELPEAPLKPKLPLIIGIAGVALGLLVGLGLGTLLELLRGRLLAPWQVKRLGLPLLGEARLTDFVPSDR